jgi:uncharacterized protein
VFKNTRIKGFKIPFHTNFEEVNLRFYVRFKQNGGAEWFSLRRSCPDKPSPS